VGEEGAIAAGHSVVSLCRPDRLPWTCRTARQCQADHRPFVRSTHLYSDPAYMSRYVDGLRKAGPAE
jgi:hypothetical protein